MRAEPRWTSTNERGEPFLDSGERAALLDVLRPLLEVGVLAEEVANHHAVHFPFTILDLRHAHTEVNADDVREHDPAIQNDIRGTLSVFHNLRRKNKYFVCSLSLSLMILQ